MTDANDPLLVRLSSQGRPLPGMTVRALDLKTRRPLPPDEIGELAVGGNITPGYYQAPELDAAAFDADGFFLTGDLGSIGPDGRIRFRGRLKEMIKTSGINVAPLEVEEVLLQHPISSRPVSSACLTWQRAKLLLQRSNCVPARKRTAQQSSPSVANDWRITRCRRASSCVWRKICRARRPAKSIRPAWPESWPQLLEALPRARSCNAELERRSFATPTRKEVSSAPLTGFETCRAATAALIRDGRFCLARRLLEASECTDHRVRQIYEQNRAQQE